MKRYFLPMCAVALLIVCRAYADTTRVEVITLQNRTAEELVPILRPFVGKNGTISGMGNQLVVQATPAALERIKDILARIDKVQRLLLITVKQNVTAEELEGEKTVSGSITIGDDAHITVDQADSGQTGIIETKDGEDNVKVRGRNNGKFEQADDTQYLRVLEGNQVFIRIGSSVPYPERTVVKDRHGVTIIDTAKYQDVTSGFYVLPRLSGDQVILEIRPQHKTVEKQGTVRFQGADTRATGRLGEWIEIGGIERKTSDGETEILASTKHEGSGRYGIFVKVEEIN